MFQGKSDVKFVTLTYMSWSTGFEKSRLVCIKQLRLSQFLSSYICYGHNIR